MVTLPRASTAEMAWAHTTTYLKASKGKPPGGGGGGGM
jgi:hypothetical protein